MLPVRLSGQVFAQRDLTLPHPSILVVIVIDSLRKATDRSVLDQFYCIRLVICERLSRQLFWFTTADHEYQLTIW